MTSDDLLTNLKDRGGVPPAQSLTSDKILNIITGELLSVLVPKLIMANEEFLTDQTDIPLVNGVAYYPVPARAFMSGFRVLKYVDSSGAESPRPLDKIELADIGSYASFQSNPIGFYMQATDIMPVPTPVAGTTGSLRVYYNRAPGDLVRDALDGSNNHTQVGIIASVTATAITLNGPTSGWAAGQKIDITGATSPYRLLGRDISCTASAVSGTNITVTGIDLTTLGISAGDYVTLQRTSYVPQIPRAWHEVLLDLGTAAYFREVGQGSSSAATYAIAMEKMKLALGVSAPRAQQNVKHMNAWRGWRRKRF